MELTKLQSELLEILRAFISDNGYAPTFKELADAKGVTTTAVFEMMEAMKKKGAVDWKAGQSRTFRIIEAVTNA